MKRSGKKFISFLVIISLILTHPIVVFADFYEVLDETNSVTTQAMYDLLLTTFEAADTMKEIETLLDNQISFDVTSINPENYDAEWREDARQFIQDTLDSSPQMFEEETASSENIAKATSIKYAMDCAQWSIDKGRGVSFVDESAYMFISHYIDRPEYYWSNGDYSYLMDGESMSEHSQYYAKWITRDDRVAYNTYINQGRVNASLSRLKNICAGYMSLMGDRTAFNDLRTEMQNMGLVMLSAKGLYIAVDSSQSGGELIQDVVYIGQTLMSSSTETNLSTLYQTFIEDDNLFRNLDDVMRDRLVTDTMSMYGGFLLGGLAGGATQIGTNLISFTIDAYLDLVDTAAYAIMRYSFHARHAQRMTDYMYDMYL